MNRMWVRLSLVFTVVVLFGVFVVGAIGFVVTDANIRRRILVQEAQDAGGLIDILARHYRAQHSWQGVEKVLDGAQATMPFRARGGLAFILTDGSGRIINSNAVWMHEDELSPDQLREALPIQVNDTTVGFLAIQLMPPPRMSRGNFRMGQGNAGLVADAGLPPGEPSPLPGPPPLSGFFRDVGNVMAWTAILFGILGTLFGIIMSRNLTAPLRRLAEAAQAIGKRDFSKRVEITGTEEIREVARAFNEMVGDLEQGETLRRNLLADVSHELRTPLSVLQGNLRAILDGVYPLEFQEIAGLYDQTRLLGRLVEDLHELTRAEAKQLPLNVQTIDMKELIQQAAAAFEPVTEAASISLRMSVPDGLPKVRADLTRMAQVLNNLLSNALRHTPSGGTITIGCQASGDSVRLSVQDTGEGIAPRDLPHVFDRFYRADPTRNRATGGAGLGLAIVRAIVEMHGGQAWAESDGTAGHGSRFVVELPAIDIPLTEGI